MIKSSTKTTVRGQDKVDKLMKILKSWKNAYVSVGVHEDAGQYPDGQSVVQVALWNEFGTEHIPSRSFFRSAIDENMGRINKWRDQVIEDIIDGKRTPQNALETLGFRVQQLIVNKIKSNVPPPLKNPQAKMRKGLAPVTLIETGLLMRSISFKVVKE